MSWLNHAFDLAKKAHPFVIVTVASVKGHAPRGLGSKMLVSQESTQGSVGGGNLEQIAIAKAKEMLEHKIRKTDLVTVRLNPQNGEYGVQCCGGEVSLFLELVLMQRPNVVIFGAGHVGWALVHVLSIFPIDIYLIDSREKQLERDIPEMTASLHRLHKPIPESALSDLPQNSHLLIMTHDHAEDIAILDLALQHKGWSFLGLIGSRVKWSNFQQTLKKQGHSDADLARITTPIGLASLNGKSPQVIAVATAAQLLTLISFEESDF